MYLFNASKILAVMLALTLMVGCSVGKRDTVIEREIQPDGTTVEREMDGAIWVEKERQKLGVELVGYAKAAVTPADTQLSSQGEVAHSFQVITVTDKMEKIMGNLGAGYFDHEIVKTRERHATGRQALYMLAPQLLGAVLHGTGPAANGGTEITQNNNIEGSSLNNAGGVAGGDGGPGGEAPGGDGGSATGGGRTLSIGGIGNMSNSQDAYNGFQSEFKRILHGQGAIGKQPQVGNAPGNTFAPTDDRDEGRVGLSPDIF